MPSQRSPRSDRGASAVEYGLIVFVIAALVSIAVFALGNVTNGLHETSCAGLDEQAAAASSDDC